MQRVVIIGLLGPMNNSKKVYWQFCFSSLLIGNSKIRNHMSWKLKTNLFTMHFHVIRAGFYCKIAEIFWWFPQTSYDSSFLLDVLHLHRGRDFCRFNVFCSRLKKVISKGCSDLAYFYKRFEFSKKIGCGWKNKIAQFPPQVKDKNSYRVQMAIHSRWKNLNKKSERIMS